jgi:hypothetical protein
MKYSIRMWQEEDNKPIFRFQTDDVDAHFYMSVREEFELVGEGKNVSLWIYRAEFSSVKKAMDVFRLLNLKNT